MAGRDTNTTDALEGLEQLVDMPDERVPPRYRHVARSLRESRHRKLTGEDDETAIDLLANRGELYAQALVLSRIFAQLAQTLPRGAGALAVRMTSRAEKLAHREAVRLVSGAWEIYNPRSDRDERIWFMSAINFMSRRPAEEINDDEIGEIVRAWRDDKPGAKKTSGSGARMGKFRLLSRWYAKQGVKVSPERLKKDWFAYLAGT